MVEFSFQKFSKLLDKLDEENKIDIKYFHAALLLKILVNHQLKNADGENCSLQKFDSNVKSLENKLK